MVGFAAFLRWHWSLACRLAHAIPKFRGLRPMPRYVRISPIAMRRLVVSCGPVWMDIVPRSLRLLSPAGRGLLGSATRAPIIPRRLAGTRSIDPVCGPIPHVEMNKGAVRIEADAHPVKRATEVAQRGVGDTLDPKVQRLTRDVST